MSETDGSTTRLSAAQRWFGSDVAARLTLLEQRQLIPSLSGMHGPRGLYLRPSAALNSDLSGSLIPQLLCSHAEGDGWVGDVAFDGKRIPLESESLSMAYLLHSLDHVDDPQALLQEVERVLMLDGSLMVVGLNPRSPWSWRWQGRGPRGNAPSRVRSWIDDAGMTPIRLFRVGPWLPFSRPSLDMAEQRPSSVFGALSAGYAWLARKRPGGLTPDAERLRARKKALRSAKAAINAG